MVNWGVKIFRKYNKIGDIINFKNIFDNFRRDIESDGDGGQGWTNFLLRNRFFGFY